MKRTKIAVIAGGNSSEVEVSIKSSQQVFDCLDRDVFDPKIVIINKNGWNCDGVEIDKNDFSLCGVRFDYALIMIHGTPGENGILQGYFELLDIPYSSCGVEVSALTFNKSLCKSLLGGIPGINLAKEIILNKSDRVDLEFIVAMLGLPLFIKPNASGSSCGVTKIKEIGDIDKALEVAFLEGDQVMCEEYIQGIEVSQGVMITQGQEWVLPITELVSKNEFFDYQAKYTDGLTQEITPARISHHLATQISETTLSAYKALGCRGIVRIDYIIKDDKPYFIEVNTVPGMSCNSIVPQQWREIGLTMGQAWEMIIRDTITK